MREGRKFPWQTLLRLVVGGTLLVWIFHRIFLEEAKTAYGGAQPLWETLARQEQWNLAWRLGPSQLWSTIRQLEPAAFGLSLVCVGLTILLGLIRWRIVLRAQGLELPFSRTAEISLVAQFFNAFLLGSTGGDLLKAYYAARETHHKKPEAVVTVVIDRLLGLFSMLLFACVLMIPNLPLLGSDFRFAAVAGIILAMMLACGTIVLFCFRSGVSRRFPQARQWLRNLPKGESIERAVDAARRLGNERLFLGKTLGLSMVVNIVCVLQVMLLARGFGVGVPVLALSMIVPMVTCLSALPISLSGLGIREGLFVEMLGIPAIGLNPKVALSISLLTFAGSLFWSVIGGVVYMTRKKQDHLEEIAETDEST